MMAPPITDPNAPVLLRVNVPDSRSSKWSLDVRAFLVRSEIFIHNSSISKIF